MLKKIMRRDFPLAAHSFVFAAVSMMFHAPIAWAQASSLWTPSPRPAECAIVDAQLLILDVSQSMRSRQLFARAIEQVAKYIDEAPACTYVILGRFGTTADVIDDGFVTALEVRSRLKASLFGLRPRHATTNMDEAARLMEWVQFKLAAAYQDVVTALSVKVLTDEISDPDSDKPTFSLRRFFEEHLASSRVRVLEVALTPSGAPTAEVPKGERYVVLATPVSSLGNILRQTTGPSSATETPAAAAPTEIRLPAANTAPARPGATQTGAERVTPERMALSNAATAWTIRRRLVILGLSCSLLLLLVVGVLGRRARELGAEPAESLDTEGPLPDIPTTLVITERELPGEVGAEPRVLRHSQRLPIAANAQVSFGTDAGRCTCVVVPVEGVEADELFSVTPTRGGLFHLKTIPDAICNGRAVPPKGLTLAANETFRIRIGQREWTVAPSLDAAEHAAADALFTRVHHHRGVAADAVRP